MTRLRPPVLLLLLALALLAGVITARTASGALADERRVDVLLALTVDVSLSMDLEEQRLQRDGYVNAFRDPTVLAAIGSGARRRIAVTYIEWAGPGVQSTIVPWTLVDGPESADRVAAILERQPISRARMTSISGALIFAAREIERAPFVAPRRVIDVSGDGPNNAGHHVVPTRDEVVARDIVINGLPLQLKVGGPNSAFDIPNLDRYYADCVIGGPGSFSLPVRDKSEIATAIRKKMVLEIAGLTPGPSTPTWTGTEQRPGIVRTQALQQGAPADGPADCLIGEKLWQRYLDGRFYR